ncbi:MAG: hypothetical protein AB8A46_01750 [Prochlorococcus sp.]|jgi:hypothetical protein|nr:hypothetical protein [Prochlorococcus sp.]MDP6193080.1 hypothetical protein [Prochlorococcaceae cyanobacterium ETNP18_MAG_1]CAI8172680.1 MAG: Uncharacterised protein [Prochlorococcus marinus str. MIT 9215]
MEPDSSSLDRRLRLHQLVVALIQKQGDLELMDEEAPRLDVGTGLVQDQDPARWLDRNRRLLKRYQALVRSAVTIDALLDAEQGTQDSKL